MRAFGFFALCLGVLVSGCSEDEVGTDTPAADSAVADTATVTDSATVDSTTVDSSTVDSSSVDSSTASEAGGDSGTADTASLADSADTFVADTFVADTFVADTFVADTSVADVGTMSFASDIQPIFSAKCTGCHSGAAASAGMSLATGAAYASLVNVNASCDLTGLKRVLPGSTANSMLWRKLANDPARCGSAMPLGTAGLKTLDPVAFAKIGAWIAQGAPNN